MKSTLTVCRKWNNPTIMAFVDNTEIGATMILDDYLNAVLQIVGSPTFVMTKAQLAEKVKAASDQVISEMKRATVHV